MKLSSIPGIKFRSSTISDLPFVLSLHHETLKDYIEPIWGWEKAKWDEIITKWFKPERLEIIQKGSEDIGILVVEEKSEEILFESISLIPKFQKHGIGTKIIQEVVLQAKDKSLPVRLEVLKTNSSAQKLYTRLGFKTHAITNTHFRMETTVG